MTDAPALLVSEEDGILVATFNRPEKYNAMNQELMRLLSDAVDRLRDAPELRVMLIRSTGKYFSAGADMKETANSFAPTRSSEIREMHRRLPMRRVWDEIEYIEKPFVVAHQGMCIGGGFELSLACDFRLAAASAAYSFPEAKFGTLPATNGISRLVRMVGPHWARYLVMGNKPVDAALARTIGLVHEVCPDEDLDANAMAFCRHLLQQDSELMGIAKISIELAADLDRIQAASVERLANSALMLAPGYREGVDKHIATVGKKRG